MEDLEEIKSSLSLAEILQLKESCSKKVFHNFLNKSYSVDLKKAEEKPKPSVELKSIKTKSKFNQKDDDQNDEFKKLFGCERPKNYKPSIKPSILNPDLKSNQEEEVINEHDKPIEKSAKFRPSKLRVIFKTKQKKNEPELRDPRFENTSGYFNPTRFDKSYGFVKEARSADKQALKKQLNKTKSETKRTEIEKVIQRIDNQERSEAEKKKRSDLRQKLIEEKRMKLKQKKEKPVFVNKSEMKKKELVEKFKELKNKNQLSKYIERKRKKNTSRERKLLFADE